MLGCPTKRHHRHALGPQFDKLKSVSFESDPGAGGGGALPDHDDQSKNKNAKAKPMSKKLSSSISACSSKLTEILSWQSKLGENKVGLILGCTDPTRLFNILSLNLTLVVILFVKGCHQLGTRSGALFPLGRALGQS